MTEYMTHEQCRKCELDHCCWSLGSLLDEDNKPGDCKYFRPKVESE